MTICDLLWWLALLAGLVTGATFLYSGHAETMVVGQIGAVIVGLACLWTFWEPRRRY